MILKTIACEGKVLEPWMLMDEIDVVDLESGIKKSGTFHFICRECDALYFQDYPACRDDMFNTSEKFLEILCFRHFARHVEFSRTRKNGRKKQVVDSIEVSVILHMV